MLKQRYIYFLRLAPDLPDLAKWTDRENNVVDRYFSWLQDLMRESKLVLAGRTLDEDPTGLVILEAESETEARYLMENDPAVKNGIMTAGLHPYRIVLMRM